MRVGVEGELTVVFVLGRESVKRSWRGAKME